MTIGSKQLDMSDKKLDRERNDESGIYLHVSAIIFALVCVAVMVAAVGLLAGFLPDRTCQNESFPTKGPTYDVTTEGSNDPLTTTDPNTIWKDPRLPDTFVPLHYDLEMKTDLNNFVFDGKVTVTVLCMKATNLLVLNSNKLQIPHTGGVEILPESRGGIPSIIRVSVDEANQYLNVVFDNNLEENREYRVLVRFQGVLNDNIKGFYRSSYTAADGINKRWLAVTFFSPTNARMAFPCFDDPGLKANLTLTMIHPEDYTALGNMPAEGAPTSPDPDGFVTTRFATSPKISTYLVCFAVLDFPSIEITSKHNILIRGWARPDATDSLQYGLDMTARTLDFYIEHIGMDFPLPKIDVVAVPDFEASAMENWGLITYRETALLNTASTTSQRTTGSQGFTIAHEMGHQYFGNLVTHKWWEYILLKEGGATYLAYTSLPAVQPTWQYQDLFVIERVTTAMSTDALPNARPVQKDVATLADIAASFDRAITYSKGPSILRMCENILGKATFKRGLMTYMRRYAFGTATNDDFWECMQEAVDEDGAPIDIVGIMHTWVLQSGFPLINITTNFGNSDKISFKAEQIRFLISQDKADTKSSLWMIPLWIQTPTSSNTAPVWMNNQTEIDHVIDETNADWLLINPDRFGYYRVNYDSDNWQRLVNQLLSNHTVFSVSSRATLIDDSFTLARAGKLGYSVALEITRYLENEKDYVPWAASQGVMSYLDRLLITTGAYGSFIKYMRNQIRTLYKSFGWTDGESHLEILTHALAIDTACRYGLRDCEDKSLELFREWMANETYNLIPINQKQNVYCTAIATGRTEEFDFALRQYLNTTDAAQRSALLMSLACTRQSWQLNTLLYYTIDSAVTIKAQDVPATITAVAANPIGASLAWDFFRANYELFLDRFGDSLFHFGRIVQGVTKPFTSEFHLQELEKFIAEHPDQGTGAAAFAQAVEEIQSNVRWMESHYDEVKTWLDESVAT